MFENEDKFPKAEEYVCPPKKAKDAHGMTLYKFNNNKKIPSEYLEPMISKGSNKPKNNKQRCLMCGHSVFLNYDFVKVLASNNRVSKGILKKWKYVYKIIGGSNSKLLETPTKNFENHHTYWHFGNKIEDSEYEFVCDVHSIIDDKLMEG
ncbi:hypothetical protein K4R68_03815 [Staphylococcus epidermidis]|uniref:hypothetical protein n=1 Tax=Staphylococcus epidermidis TaxID=1282 RepID=UPI0021A2A5D6|nr:hypothetical protein [Staphylococcus epidermidis]MCG1129266.1 hypothetical protein [Staphylococcus epidermidis]MCG1168384.1 hypothetical protein [Staphylococcus epidermidis]MCG1298533.1 hypothetical protein [Staphylococcus epidermidis]MCG1362406.1 hypothetical protein [Staphylococcus epidermidis]MCG1433395.1 hypothetical protein [Staphylococcus epidermidis]